MTDDATSGRGPAPLAGRSARRMRSLAVAAVLTLLFGIMGIMTRDVIGQLQTLRSAASDNLQWTLSQVDGEFLRYRHALDQAQYGALTRAPSGAASGAGLPAPGDLAEIRKRFDIFYSRLDTFHATGTYSSLRSNAEFERTYHDIGQFRDRTGALIDLPDDGLAAALPQLQAEAEAIAPRVRSLALMGLSEFAKYSDATRVEVTTTLARLAMMTGGMFLAISLLAMLLLRLYRLSERRAVDQMLTSARMRTVIQTSLDGIIVCDRHVRILDFSPAAEAIFGYTVEEVLGHDLLTLILPEDRRPAGAGDDLAAALHNPAPETLGRLYVDGIARDGRIFPAEVSVRLAEGDQGRIFVLFIRDISQLKQAEAALIRAHDRAVAGEKAKAEFVAVMSHEMRTPLNGLLGTMSLLLDTRLDAQQQNYLASMEVSGQLLSGLVNDILDISKLDAGMMRLQSRPFSLSQIVEDVVANQRGLAKVNGITLDWDWIGPRFEPTLGDPDKIRQVLLNFVNNAIKFTPRGGVRIEVEAEDPHAAQSQVDLRVIDTGLGIDETDLERIFRDFEMIDSSYGRRAGTGLGLGISRRLAGLMGGEVGVESTRGEGSVFWIRLPLQRSTTALPQPVPRLARAAIGPLPVSARALSVLIVEDNEINRTILHHMLAAAGHRVTEACDGREGVERAAATRFDAILMDISMPVMNGREATLAIRAGGGASADVPIIAVTAHALPEEVADFHAAGMTDVLKKPVDRREVVGLLAELAGGAADGGRSPAVATAPDPVPQGPVSPARTEAGRLLFDPSRLLPDPDAPVPAAVRALAGRFIAQMDDMAATLEAEARAGSGGRDDAQRVQLLHRCAGAAGTFGADALHARLQLIETAYKSGDTGPLSAAAAGVPPLWQRTRAQIEVWLAALPPG